MDQPEIEKQQANELAVLIESAATSLVSSFERYWPSDEHDRNDPCEQNVCIHLAHAMLNSRFATFAEAWHTDGGRIDLLGISPAGDWFVAAEAKRLLCNKPDECIASLLRDAERLNRFWLNERLRLESVGRHRIEIIKNCRCGIGLIGGMVWVNSRGESSLLDLWRRQRTNLTGTHAEFAAKMDALGTVWIEPRRLWFKEGRGGYYLLTALFRISRLSELR